MARTSSQPLRLSISDILQDVGLLGLSIAAAVLLARSGAIHELIVNFGEAWILAAFIAGIFFTSIFTAAPAAAAILLIAQDANVWLVALVAALGSLAGDFLMFRFVRERFTHYLRELARYEMRHHRLAAAFRMRPMRWIVVGLGALVIASPLPDEIGIALLGFARVSSTAFAPLAFTANFLGLLAIAFIGNSFAP